MLQLKDNPPLTYSSLRGEENLSEEDWQQTWMIAYCKSRQEKAFAWDLQQHGITYFLPMVLRETSSGGRRRRNLYPLFASYVFFAGDEEARQTGFNTNRIVQLVPVEEATQPRLRRELASLERALRECPKSVELHPRVVNGAHVTIRAFQFFKMG